MAGSYTGPLDGAGLHDGDGVWLDDEGGKYEGSFKNGKRDGKGRLRYDDIIFRLILWHFYEFMCIYI